MSYSYYRSAPGWGTNQFQFGAPPAPTWQPQPSWGGADYYRAHAPSPDLDLYGHAWNRVRDVRDYSGSTGPNLGVGVHEARVWHKKAYLHNELNHLQPAEVGHAAAYEAYRTWIHNSSIYEPLSGETERQREGLIGLAVAETTRLLNYTALNMDPYARRSASEAAAMTASILFYWSRDHNDDEYRGRSGYGGATYDDPYSFDSNVMYPHRGRSHSRRRSASRSSFSHMPPMSGGSVGGMSMSGSVMGTPYPGQAGSAYMGQPAGYPGQSGSYPGQSYVGSQYGGGSQYVPGAGYASSEPAFGPGYPGQASGVPMVHPMQGRARSMSMSVPYAPIQGTPYQVGSVPAPQVVVVKSHKKHRSHRHHSKHRSRSRSRY